MKQSMSVSMSGYFLDGANLLSGSGAYCVYRCTHDSVNSKVSIKELIYIGESENVSKRVVGHEKLADWKKQLRLGEVLCFSSGAVSSLHRVRTEAALIFRHKPVVNIEYRDNFPFDETSISLSGEIAQLITSFTIQRTSILASFQMR